METILKQFVDEPLFDACAALLNHLHISFNEVTRTPVPFEGLYRNTLTKALREILPKVEHTYFIGTVDEASLSGAASRQDENEVTAKASEGKYVGMMIFAVDIKPGQTLTRTELATLTRGFNRIAAAQPVVLFIKQGDRLALATCERSEYTQQWRDGEKLGKVSLLRGINCLHPHRGHIDILQSIGDKAYPTFEELYKHWMQVFSSELLTKKFYSELSDWYAWAVQVARFPNDLTTTADDEKFNHESCIRLITRLIFVWFLKQKHLIPEEFFDENYIREHFIEEFNPHDRENLLYNPEKSKYYRLILQNLFFAMLNRPIAPEGKDTPNNRRFRGEGQKGYLRSDYNVNNLMRYKNDFKAGGANEFLKIANSSVPFLNGGLFDCLDDKPKNLYYDGFSERKESLEQLYLPDWLFFGNEVGQSIDLSEWYGDAKKKRVSAQGIIDILKKYNFTIEENTPLDQEVSLDPELLGKAFENLLAAYNPETKTSARKQTGSFYTPREIVQYMVDESLVAHLKRICGDELEPEYRSLLSYATEETTLNEEQRRSIMKAIYDCRVLDPACGSGAFPMGVLQQMVHILRQVDSTNEMWKDFMIDLAIEQSRKAFNSEEEDERKTRLADIEEAFNRHVNDPDYARKLYLIEHCIYGVDIQPIAVQISKLRFFISLVVDQNPTGDAAHNFGIRPLPNLESKFVAANTLIPVEYDASLFESTEAILSLKEQLKELNHKIFLAKRNIDKQRLKAEIKETRRSLAKAIEDTGFVNPGAAQKLADWDMFEQNTHADFFDAEWMFGVKGGFDIVIANPPYISVRTTLFDSSFKPLYRQLYSLATGQYDLYTLFIEKGNKLLTKNGILSYIIPTRMLSNENFKEARKYVCENIRIMTYVNAEMCFDNVSVEANIMVCQKGIKADVVKAMKYNQDNHEFIFIAEVPYNAIEKMPFGIFPFVFDNERISVFNKLLSIQSKPLSNYLTITRGFECGKNDSTIGHGNYKFINAESIKPYLLSVGENIYCSPDFTNTSKYKTYDVFKAPKLVTKFCSNKIQFAFDNIGYCNTNSVYNCSSNNEKNYKFLLGILNSRVITFWFNTAYLNIDNIFPHIQKNQLDSIPIPEVNPLLKHVIEKLSSEILSGSCDIISTMEEIDRLIYHLYGLNYDDVLIIDPTPPFTRDEYENETIDNN